MNQFYCILSSLGPFLITLEYERTEEVLRIAGSPNLIKPAVFVCLSIGNFVRNDVQLDRLYLFLRQTFVEMTKKNTTPSIRNYITLKIIT